MASTSRPPHVRRTSSDTTVETLPPEPVQSNPVSIRPAHTPNEDSSKSFLSDFKPPSVLQLVQGLHRYSSYAFTGFFGLHLLNTNLIPLSKFFSSPERALSTIDNGFMITRYLYRPTLNIEMTLVFVPIAIHVFTGIILRIRRILQDRRLYGEGLLAWHARQTRINRQKGLSWPRLRALPSLGYSATAASGWATLLYVTLHCYTTRIIPFNILGPDAETSVTIVTHALRKHPYLCYTLYLGLIGASSFHVISGWGRWLRLTFSARGRRIKNYVVVGTVAAWSMALVRIGTLKIFSQADKIEYDRLYRHLWRGF